MDEDDLTPKTTKNYSLKEMEKTWMAKTNHDSLFISATKKENIDSLKRAIYLRVKEIHKKRFPYNDYLYLNYDEKGNVKN